MMRPDDVLLACPVCGRLGVRIEDLGAYGPCDGAFGWSCDGCRAAGWGSGFGESSWVRVDMVPRFASASFVVPPARPLVDLLPPFPGRPIDDAAGLWDDGRRRPVLASSGVELGDIRLDDGVFVVETWLGRSARGMLFDEAADVRAWVADGACGILPAGAYIGPRRLV